MKLISFLFFFMIPMQVFCLNVVKFFDFPEECANLYFNARYKSLIEDPEGFVSRKETIKSTIIPESNNHGTCYANSVENTYEGYEITPHPYYTAIISKTFFNFINQSVTGGYPHNALQALNNKMNICDHKTFNNYYEFDKDKPADRFLFQINAHSLKHNYLLYPASWGTDYQKSWRKSILNILQDAVLENLTPIQVQEIVMNSMCEEAGAIKINPLYRRLEIKYSFEPYKGRDIENFLSTKESMALSEQTNDEANFAPSFFDQIGNSYNLSDDNTGASFHAYTVLGTRWQPKTNNGKAQCQIVLKDSNPHYNNSNCKSSNGITRIYDSGNSACYLLTSFHLLKNQDLNKPRINLYTSVN